MSVVRTTEPPPTGDLSLSVRPYKVKGVQHVELTWQNYSGELVEISRDGLPLEASPVDNSGTHVDNIGAKGGGSYNYEVCEAGTANCATATASF